MPDRHRDRDQQDERLGEKFVPLKSRQFVQRVGDQNQIQLAIQERLLMLVTEPIPHRDALGVLPVEQIEDNRRDEAAGYRGEHADSQVWNRNGERTAHRGPQILGVEEQLFGTLEHHRPGHRQPQRAKIPIEYRSADRGLEVLDLLRNRRLGHVENRAGRGHAALLGNDHEDLQCMQQIDILFGSFEHGGSLAESGAALR